ncbi:MAG: BspA family leucine-rich repeat surface protein [Coriobacteriales bacterium]|nr:BspA family leucine-rich repeat surface protein [Coriobacteriales bacterium]
MHVRWKRGLSFLVTASMVLGLVPAPALAEAVEEAGDVVVVGESTQGNEQQPEQIVAPGNGVTEGGNSGSAEGQSPNAPEGSIQLGAQGTTEAPTAIALSTEYQINTAEGESWYGTFTAQEAGTYDFQLSTTETTAAIVLGNDDTYTHNGRFGFDYDYSYGFKPSTVTRYLDAGDTLYVMVNGYWGEQAMTGTLQVSASSHTRLDFSVAILSIENSQFMATDTIAFAESIIDCAGQDIGSSYYDLAFYQKDQNGEYTPISGVPSTAGTYGVAARAKDGNAAGYTGETEKRDFTILDPSDLSSPGYWTLCFADGSNEYTVDGTGQAISIPATKMYRIEDENEITLTENTDYELLRIHNDSIDSDVSQIVDPGEYRLYYKGKGAYAGTHWDWLRVRVYGNGKDLSLGRIEVYSSPYEASDDPVTLQYEVYDCNNESVSSDYYDLVYYAAENASEPLGQAPSAPGTYWVAARGKVPNDADYSGETPKAQFEIMGEVGEDNLAHNRFYSGFSPNWILHTGNPITWPTPHITYQNGYGEVELVEGTDYELDHYEDLQGNTIDVNNPPSDLGEYHALYKGIGAYTGVCDIPFFIVEPNDIGSTYWDKNFTDLRDEYAYTGQPVSLATAEIYRRDEHGNIVETLKEGEDFEYTGYIDCSTGEFTAQATPTDIGDYNAVYRGKSPYTGEATLMFSVVDASDLSQGEVVFNGYDSYEVPTFAVSDDISAQVVVKDLAGGVLTNGTDYDLVYYDEHHLELPSAPTMPGTYWVAARGKSNGTTGYIGETSPAQFMLRTVDVTPVNIENNGDYPATCSSQNQWVGKFVAPASATYEFYTTGEYSTGGELYRDPWRGYYLTSDWGSGDGGNFRIMQYLEEGKTAYLFVSDASYSSDGIQTTVHVRTVDNTNLANGQIRFYESTIDYTGNPVQIDARVIDSMQHMLVEGTDYELVYYEYDGDTDQLKERDGAPVEDGNYAVAARAKRENTAGYTGETDKVWFSIVDRFNITSWRYFNCSLQNCDYRTEDGYPAYFYTGSALTPQVKLYCDETDEDLVQGEDYTVTYANNTEVTGDESFATATVEGKGQYRGTVVLEFAISSTHDLNAYVQSAGATLKAGSVERTFAQSDACPIFRDTGSLIQPSVTLNSLDGVAAPVADVDYTVSYEQPNQQAGSSDYEYAVVLTATKTSQFSGETRIPYEVWESLPLYAVNATPRINNVPPENVVIRKDESAKWYFDLYGYEGNLAELTWDIDSEEGTLVSGTDYDVEVIEHEGVIEYMFEGKDNYCQYLYVYVRQSNAISLEDAALSIEPQAFTYTGEALTPDVTVTYDEDELEKDVDYVVSYQNNVNAGTATVTVTGRGDYVGTLTQQFTIVPATIEASDVVGVAPSANFTGSQITMPIGVIHNGKTLQVGDLSDPINLSNGDYAVEYDNNTNAGTATVTVTGRNNYTGTVTKTFTINPVAMDSDSITITGVSNKTYTGSAIEQSDLAVQLGTYPLEEGTDYTVGYQDNIDAGTATVTVTAKENGNFTGSQIQSFTISPAIITDDMIADIPDQTYTGAALEPAPVVTFGNKTLISGTDYSVEYSNNVHKGTATVTVTGKGNFTGSASKTFTVKPATITSVDPIANRTYTGDAITPAPVVKVGDRTIDQGNYTVNYTNNVNAGTATVTVVGANDYDGTVEATFTIEPRTIEADGVTGIAESANYTGFGIIMPVVVTTNGKTLQAADLSDLVNPDNGDYSVAYTDNTNAGTATVTVTGRNNYTGTVTKTFTINPVAINSDSVTVTGVSDKEYTGSAIEQSDLTLQLGTYTLVKDTDYTVGYQDNINKGQATITITAKSKDNGGSGNFTGSRTQTFNITGKVLDENNTTISAIDPVTYNGSEQKPKPTVTLNEGNRVLIKDTDYELSYNNNVDAGTATVTITGKGDFGGVLTKEFTIDPATVDSVEVAEATYTGSAITPQLTVKAGDLPLGEDDYDAEFSNNVNAGENTARVTVTGKGNFTGTKGATFTIAKANIASVTVSGIQNATYTGEPITQDGLSLKLGDYTLTGDDYTVTYKVDGQDTNVNAGQATMTIAGAGNFEGTLTQEFTIEKATLSEVTGAEIVPITDKTYTGSAIEPNVVVTVNGKTLTKGTDFKVASAEGTDRINVGTVEFTVTGIGNYKETLSGSFNIVPRSIESATVTGIGATTYTGAALEPAPTVKMGETPLAKDTDYEVAYANNTDAGTATVTITGKGNYTGSKTVELTIAPATVDSVEVAVAKYTGEAVTPQLTVKAGGLILGEDDYDVAFSNNTNAGTASVAVTGKGNFKGNKSVTFTIAPASITSIEAIPDQTYTGAGIEPQLVVKAGSLTLGADDYTAVFSNNTNAGTASVTVTGKGNFKGTESATFTIAKPSLTTAVIEAIPDQTYTGEAITPALTVSVDGRKLVQNTDYTVSYEVESQATNVNAGQATVTITGKGNYQETATTTFTIAPKSILRATVTAAKDKTYGQSNPDLTVTLEGKELSLADFDVTYENDVNVGTATVTVAPKEGNANYTDTATGTFKVLPASIDGATIEAIPAQTFSGKAIEPEVTVQLGDDPLAPANYTVSYSNNVQAGTATVTVTGKGNYKGTATTTFAINKVALDSDAIAVSGISDKTYTGSPLTQDGLTLKLGNYTLRKDIDYTVSYELGGIATNIDAGQATITITAKNDGNFTGSRTEHFNITQLTMGEVASATYTGQPITPAPAVFNGDTALNVGTDFDYGYANNTNAGTATVTVTGKGTYAGVTMSKQFTISPAAITEVSTESGGAYDGQAHTPTTTVKSGDVTLVEGTHYTLEYRNNVNAGTASVIANGIGNYGGARGTTFEIAAASITDATIEAIQPQTFTGKAIKPEVKVKLNDKTLDPANYTVSYSNNINVGEATVTVTAKENGNYTGFVTASFTINAKNLSSAKVTAIADQTYAGDEIEPDIAVVLDGKKLDKGTDYTVTYNSNTNVGTATVTVAAKAGGNYAGSTTQAFQIKPADIANASIESIEDQTFKNGAITPPVSLEGIDASNYDVAYENNVNVGTANVTITAKQNTNYIGSTTTTFNVVPAAITSIEDIDSQTYTGAAIEPELVVKAGGLLLGEDDCDVAFSNNVNAGQNTASVTVTGKGNYTGDATANFTIVSKSIAEATIDDIDPQVFTGDAIEPEVTVKLGGKVLDPANYTVRYADNENAGTATVTVTGQGNYTGSPANASFTIDKANIANVTVSGIEDKVFNGQAQTQGGLTLMLADYQLLNSDYKVTYGNNTSVSTKEIPATITIEGDGANFTDSRTEYFRIANALIDKATVTLSEGPYTYNGEEQRPEVESVKLGDTTLVRGTDYTVSYQNNVNAGTAAVVVTGLGGYAGEARAEFQIGAKSITGATVSAIADQPYTGAEIKPKVVVSDGTNVLVRDADYEVAFSNNVNAGENTATVTITGKGNYTGIATPSPTFTITQRSLADATVEPIADQTFANDNKEPPLTVKLDGNTLDPENYDVQYSNNKNAGIATATITAKGSNLTGTTTATFRIVPAAVKDVTGVSRSAEYTGEPIQFQNLSVTAGDLTLGASDYTATYANNLNVGKATLTIAARGNYAGGGTYEFQITPKSIAGYTVELPQDAIYCETASLDAFEPVPIVKDSKGEGGKVLDPANYDVTYLNNSVAGKATVIVTGKGNYTGSPDEETTFTIYKYAGAAAGASDGNGNAVIWHVEDGGAMTIEPKNNTKDATLSSASSLTWSQAVADYTKEVKVDNNVKGCTDTSGMFSGLANVEKVDISQFDTKDVTNMSGMFQGCESLTVGGIKGTLSTGETTNMSNMFAGCTSLDGNPLANADTSGVQNMSGMFAGCTSLESLDFGPQVQQNSTFRAMRSLSLRARTTSGFSTQSADDMSNMFADCPNLKALDLSSFDTSNVTDMSNMFANCTSLRTLNLSSFDTANVSSMNGMYEGCTLDEFTIGENYLNAQNDTEQNITVELPTPTASNGMWWAKGAQAWRSNDAIRALGKQAADTYSRTGLLNAALTSIASADIDASSENPYVYDGTAHTPAVEGVTIGKAPDQIDLVEGVDYEVDYRNNTNAGEARVVVRGIGDYSESATRKFGIQPKSIRDNTVSVTAPANAPYDGRQHKNKPTVRDTKTNRTLAEGTDYTLSWSGNVTNAGTVTVTITGKGNYQNTTTATFSINRARIAVPKATNRTYNGRAQTGVPTGSGYKLTGTAQATDAGSYTATATPDGNHCWSDGTTAARSIKWSISAANLSGASIAGIGEQAHTGGPIEPRPAVSLGGTTLREGTDYTLSYRDNVNPGTATVTVTGRGNYTGSRSVTFQIASMEPTPHVTYRTHVQRIGWQKYVWDGDMSGTSGRSFRLEGINVKLADLPCAGGIQYRTHVQRIGWQGWRRDGKMAGTSGKSYRLEAIEIKLYGELADRYDVYYRVHCQRFGWMGWAKNGERSGSAGYSRRLEGIQIVLVKKGDPAPDATYKGINQKVARAFAQKGKKK